MDVSLYEPVNVLKPVADDLWIIDGPVVRMAVGPGSIPFPTRAVVIRLPDGGLWVHSPTTELTDALAAALDELGPVRYLISSNAIHYAGIPVWKARYPDALAWASPGVEERAAGQGIEVSFDDALGDEPAQAWAGAIDQLIFRGSRVLEEVVFFHRASSTLLLTDLIENFEPDKLSGAGFRALIRMAGAADPDGKAPIDLRATFIGNKDIARACFKRMRAWDPQRVIMAHGRWYEHDGCAELDRAFRWLS